MIDRSQTRLLPCLALVIVAPLRAGVCAPACEVLTQTRDPFELRLRIQDGSMHSSSIFRGDNLLRTEVKEVAGRSSKTLYQANFVTVTTLPDGSSVASMYDVPTSKYIWDQEARKVHTWSNNHGTISSRAAQTYRILGDEEVNAGECAFASKHYVVTTKTASVEIIYEGWLAPALNATLKYRLSVVSKTGKKSETSATTVAIRPLPPETKAP